MNDAERSKLDQSVAETANIWRQLYNCLLSEGFSTEQAMQLLLSFITSQSVKR